MGPPDPHAFLVRAAALFVALAAGLILTFPSTVETAGSKLPSRLRARAESLGRARAIVVLNEETRPESTLGTVARVGTQRLRIAAARRRLLTELAGTSFRVTADPRRLPVLGLEGTPASLSALARSPWVASIHEDGLNRLSLAESTPLVGSDLASVAGFEGAGWTVAVLDSGVDTSHPFLAGRVVEEACFSGGANCPNGSASDFGPGSAAPCSYANYECAHGTRVAGIAAGEGSSFSGVAPGSDIIAIQVCSQFTGADCYGSGDDPCCIAFDSDIILAAEYVLELAATRPIAALNLSLGGEAYTSTQECDAENPAYKMVIDELRAAGIATIVAAGNWGFWDRLDKPACISSAISVGSTKKSDGISDFSNTAPFLSLLAPGSEIFSSVPNGGFKVASGTSMSAPHVAGAWAVLKQQDPSASVGALLGLLQQTGFPMTDTSGVTVPRIRLYNALGSPAVELPVSGRRLVIRNRVPDDEPMNRIRFVSRDPDISIAPPDSAGDPRCGRGEGGSLSIFSAESGQAFSQSLPCENWKLLGSEGDPRGYRYRDPEQTEGPCAKVVVRNPRQITAVCTGKGAGQLDFDLQTGQPQAPVGIRIITGQSFAYCAELGGEITRDGRDGKTFRARSSIPPVTCPTP
jgi:subtilisin family serine protease